MKNWTVYEHISPSGKVYIGITSAKYISQRFHRGLNYKSCKKFYCAILKYGWDNFQHNIIASNLGEMTAKNMEKDLIKFYKEQGKSYNITDGGDGAVGIKWTSDIRLKMYNVHFGRRNSIETKLRMSNSAKRVIHTKEWANKISASKKSKNNHLSNEHKELLSRIHKGKPASDKAISKAIEVNSKILFLIDSTNRVVKTYKSQVIASVDLNVSQWKISVYKDTNKEIIKGYKLVTKLKE